MGFNDINLKNFDNSLFSTNCKLSILNTCYNSGGYISHNKNLYNAIPNSKLFKIILKESVNGTPLIKIGNGDFKVMIVAGIHGNELPSQLACLYMIKYLINKNIKGSIYLIPFAAPNATMNNSRSFDGMDLNRSTLDVGSVTNRIFEVIKKENIIAVGDFHSTSINSNPGRDAIFCTLSPTVESYNIAKYVSRRVGCDLLKYDTAGSKFKGALEDECNLIGIPSITAEVLSPFGYLNKNSFKRSMFQMYSFLDYFKIL
ncbi:MAG: succinylglutamate desuccinylase/aspartoacylase family protein [Methanobrevibacter wolinii]|nr:succinylglutamate desuccinylase/aspartoacylase family protein [Methanobrevibacter wolinii]